VKYGGIGDVIVDALKHHGMTPGQAADAADRYADMVIAEHSDHAAYRELADEVVKLVRQESSPDDWDGEDSELFVLTVFLEWLPDMIRHNDAEKLRNTPVAKSICTDSMDFAADLTDPFEKTSAGQWVRKSDDRPVPWPVVRD
jgi:hypothetical protein